MRGKMKKIGSWSRRHRRITAAGGVLLLLSAGAVERDRFFAAGIAAASCDDCSGSGKIAAASRAFVTPRPVLLMPTIVGGRRTTSREFPSVGAILLDGKLTCTGTVLGAHTVLTAAHCLDGLDASRLSFKPGLNTTSALPRPVRAVAADIPNDPNLRFDFLSLTHDVGLLYLQGPIATTGVPAIDEDTSDARLSGASIVKVGYGFDDPRRTGDGVQRRIELTVSSIEPLKFRHGGEGMSICYRDSGGPSFLDGHIVGVTSSTRGCHEGADTRIALHAAWIKSRIR